MRAVPFVTCSRWGLAVLVVGASLAGLAASASARMSTPRWRKLEVGPTKPAARRHSTLVYDPTTNRAIMYGGDRVVSAQEHPVFNDVWALELGCASGTPRWVELMPDSQCAAGVTRPCARHGHVSIFADSPPRMFTFGGKALDGSINTDTWELRLDTRTWTERSSSFPGEPRYHNSAAYFNGAMYMFGGKNVYAIGMQDTWKFTLEPYYAWTHLSGNTWPVPSPSHQDDPNAPNRRYFHSQIVDARNGKTLLFGGLYEDQTVSNYYQSADGITWELMGTASTGYSRDLHSAVYDSIGARMIVFGGYNPANNGAIQSAVTALSLPTSGTPTWSTLSTTGNGPGLHAEHAAIWDPDGDRMIVFGGVDGNGDYTNDAWALEFTDTTVTDLNIQGVTSGSVTLRWTAPTGLMGNSRACSYEIRYSTNEITDETSFENATLWGSPPAPNGAGTLQNVTIGSLTHGVMYYFALKAKDASGNASPMSNVVCIQVSPYAICLGDGFASRPAIQEPAYAFGIRGIAPNPTSSPLTVSFTLAERGTAALELLDLAGRRIAGATLEGLAPGEHSVRLGSPGTIAPGYYVARLRQGDRSATRPVLVVR